MSRRAFGGWGWELSDREFGQALALIGVTARSVASGSGDVRRIFPLSRARASTLVQREVEQAGGALVWDISPLGGQPEVNGLLAKQPPLPLVAAWNASAAVYSNLEVRPARGLTNGWLATILQSAPEESLPYFQLPEPQGRMRWNWPLRIGFAADDSWLPDLIYGDVGPAFSQSVASLTEPEVGPARCDILLLETGGDPLNGLAAKDLPEASLVVLFEGVVRAEDPLGAGRIARKTNAAGIALVGIDSYDITEWLRTFVRELSHRQPLPIALRRAGRVNGFLAARRLLDANPLAAATAAMSATLGMTAALPAAEGMAVEALPEPTMANLGIARNGGGPVPVPVVRERFAEAELSYLSEGEGASDVAAVGRAAAPVLEDLEKSQAEDRYIRADVSVQRRKEVVRLRNAFEAGARHRVAVSIGPHDRDLIVAAEAIDRTALQAAAGHRLTVVLAEPTLLRKPLIGSVELPPFGPTAAVPFELRVTRKVTSVRARIIVLHRGRILQSAILSGDVHLRAALDELEAGDERGITIRPEANLRPGFAALDDRTRFHAAVVLNHDPDGSAGGTAIGRRKAAQFRLDVVGDAVMALSRALEAAERDEAFNRKLNSAKSLAYLRLLALHGRNLHTRVGRTIESTFPGRIERLQVFAANPNTMLPVELIYDLPPPVAKPGLCPNAVEAVATGRCDPKQFHIEDDEGLLDVVCPSGFWGISKIIERQAIDPSREASGFVVRSMPTPRQKTLGPLTPLLFAASDHVNDVDKKELERVSKALSVLTGERVTRVESWKDWAGAVKTSEPPLLLLLSHTELNVPEGPSLEIARIGGPELRAVAAITRNYVNLNPDRPGPVVLLLGCTTAVPLDTFQTFTVQFADMGASLVIGTIAPVLGRHAGRTAEALIEALQGVQAGAGARTAIPVGEALRDVRRELLSRGVLMSMSLAAYGDADWRLPVEA